MKEMYKIKSKRKKNEQYFVWHFPQLSRRNCAPAWLAMIHDIQTDNFGRNKFQPHTLACTLITVTNSLTAVICRGYWGSRLLSVSLWLCSFSFNISPTTQYRKGTGSGADMRTHAHAHTCLHTARVQHPGGWGVARTGELWKRWISMGWKIWQGDQGKRR